MPSAGTRMPKVPGGAGTGPASIYIYVYMAPSKMKEYTLIIVYIEI